MAFTKIKQAVILAGGEGLRLRPLTNDCPKPIVQVSGRPFADYLVNILYKNGIKEIVFLLGYRPQKFINHFGDGSRHKLKISYLISATTDNTGTRLRKAAGLLDDKFLFLFGDNYWPLNLPALIKFYDSKKVLATVTVYNNKDGRGEFGSENTVHVSPAGFVTQYDRTRKDPRLNGIDLGFYILSKAIIKQMPAHDFHFEKEVLPKLIAAQQLAAYRTDEPYYPITTVGMLKKLEKVLGLKP